MPNETIDEVLRHPEAVAQHRGVISQRLVGRGDLDHQFGGWSRRGRDRFEAHGRRTAGVPQTRCTTGLERRRRHTVTYPQQPRELPFAEEADGFGNEMLRVIRWGTDEGAVEERQRQPRRDERRIADLNDVGAGRPAECRPCRGEVHVGCGGQPHLVHRPSLCAATVVCDLMSAWWQIGWRRCRRIGAARSESSPIPTIWSTARPARSPGGRTRARTSATCS